jgi:DNA-binding NarL/FixJ family response regulator
VNPIRVIVADDHALVRAGLLGLIDPLPGIQTVGEAANGKDALRLIAEHRPQVAIMDISMPILNGLEATARATAELPETRVLVVSVHADEEYVHQALAVGANGYLLKNADKNEFELAIRATARGDGWLSPAVSKSFVAGYAKNLAGRRGPFEVLTPRQREILQLIAEGRSTKDIAQRLGLSARTVESHRAELARRLGVRGVQGLVLYAVRTGLAPAR